MLGETDRKLFEQLKTQASVIELRCEAAEQTLTKIGDERRDFVANYQTQQRRVLAHEMEQRGVTCCTKCHVMAPKDSMQYIFVDQLYIGKCGYEGECIEDVRRTRLYHACPSCCTQMLSRHGWLGEYNNSLKVQPFFHAFVVAIKDDDGWYANKFGNDVILSNNEVALLKTELGDDVVNKYSEEWGLLPKLKLDEKGKIIVCEPEPVSA